VQRIRGRVLATFFVFLLLLVWNYSFHGHQWSRGVCCSPLLFALVLAPALEAPLRRRWSPRAFAASVVILGGGNPERCSQNIKKRTTLASCRSRSWMTIQ